MSVWCGKHGESVGAVSKVVFPAWTRHQTGWPFALNDDDLEMKGLMIDAYSDENSVFDFEMICGQRMSVCGYVSDECVW